MVDPRDDTYNFNSSRGCQDDRVRVSANWLKWFFSLIFNPYLISWLIGMNPITQWNGYPFPGFSDDIAEDCSQGLEVGTSPGQLVVGGLP